MENLERNKTTALETQIIEEVESAPDPELIAISALDMLENLGKRQRPRRGKNPSSAQVSPKFFQRCEVYHPKYLEFFKDIDRKTHFDLPTSEIDDPLFRLRTRFDCSVIVNDVDTGGLAFNRFRERKPTCKSLRGKLTAFPQNIIEITELYTSDTEKRNQSRGFRYYAGWIDGRWMDINQRLKSRKVQEFEGDANLRVALAVGIQAEREWEWSVSIGLPNSGSVSFIVQQPALKELFKMREIPPGKRRREQLLTWVRHHWRKKATQQEKEEASIYVRAHLRGAASFTWEDFVCRIYPSIEDLEENERLKIMRHKGCLP